MKTFLVALFTALVFMFGGGFGGVWYTENKHAELFQEQTGLTVKEFNEAYANCVIRSGELCNLFGGFAPLSKFNDGRDGRAIKPPADML